MFAFKYTELIPYNLAYPNNVALNNVFDLPFPYNLWLEGGSIALWLAYLLLDPAAQVRFIAFPQSVQMKKLLMLLRLINGARKRKVDSDLKILINPSSNG